MHKTTEKTNRITVLCVWWGGWLVLTEIRVNEMILMRSSLPAYLQFLPDPLSGTLEEQSADTTCGHPAGEPELGAAAAASGASGGDLGPGPHSWVCCQMCTVPSGPQLPALLPPRCAPAVDAAAMSTITRVGLRHPAAASCAPAVPSLAVLTPPFGAIPPFAHSCLCPCPTRAPLLHPAVSSCTRNQLCPAALRIQLFTAALQPAVTSFSPHPAVYCGSHPAAAPLRPLAAAGGSRAALSRKIFSSQSLNSSVPLLNTAPRL